MGIFKVSKITPLDDLQLNDQINESDYSCITPSGNFVQFVYEDTSVNERRVILNPGVWSITIKDHKVNLSKTEFVKDTILDSLVQTKNVSEKIQKFFSKLHIYKELGVEVPKRGAMLYGKPGGGKTQILMKIAKEQSQDGKTAVIIWPTNKFDAQDVKELIKNLEYKDVEKLILMAEDLGGIEIDNARMPSDAALLSLLDNQEKTFKIPTMIIATTNFFHIFMENIANRSGRFDDKIEIEPPNSEARKELLKFFGKDAITEDDLKLIASKSCEKFPPAHIKEVVIRHKLYDISIQEAIKEIQKEIKDYENAYEKRYSLGLKKD